MTQMHALNAMDFCALLEREPALSLFYKHFRTWGCWQRLSRALTLNGARLVSMARLSADGAGNASLKAKLAALAATNEDQVAELTSEDTAALLSLVSDATTNGLGGMRLGKRAAMQKLGDLVLELRRS